LSPQSSDSQRSAAGIDGDAGCNSKRCSSRVLPGRPAQLHVQPLKIIGSARELNELRGPTLPSGKVEVTQTTFSFYFVLLVNDRRTIRSVGGYAGGSEKNQEIDQP
jgi:hypothetical protein